MMADSVWRGRLEWRFVDNARRIRLSAGRELRTLGVCSPVGASPVRKCNRRGGCAESACSARTVRRGFMGRRKDLRPDDFALAERCLGQLASVMAREFKRVWPKRRRGRGGRARLRSDGVSRGAARAGVRAVCALAKLDQRLRAVDLVITGEGAIDESTLMGKGVGQMARSNVVSANIPCIGLAGETDRRHESEPFSNKSSALTDLTTAAEARARPGVLAGATGGDGRAYASERRSVNCSAFIASRKGRKDRKVLM